MAARICQECKQPSSKRDRVCYSREDRRYLHGACRGRNPRARRKNPMNRWFWNRANPPAMKAIRIKRKEGDAEKQATP